MKELTRFVSAATALIAAFALAVLALTLARVAFG